MEIHQRQQHDDADRHLDQRNQMWRRSFQPFGGQRHQGIEKRRPQRQQNTHQVVVLSTGLFRLRQHHQHHADKRQHQP
ncbi:hypothetical protein D3C80_1880280 [compost metagenome]